ncbi:uncharacterized protein LOC128629187 [Ictalurus punctatus]|uniref:Uncharacterized protein LOC128629187 n=1 Tax=Ictalurus punctatus TaxID=7998 RepID=A0A9F7TE90_ICTPU|nr:uncharacterized protein LOC128629187 [Ictalurus punctatus]
MKLLSVVLLLLPLSLCLAEVVNDFTQSCPGFFATPNDVVSPPTGFTGDRFKRICQTLNDKAEFATLYDTTYRIPVYSAYRFTGLKKCKRSKNWYIEPQLENGTLGPNMDNESAVGNIVNQAKNGDYKKSGYDRGHLAPVFHATSQNCANATFTLTNIAPQIHLFNSGKWNMIEKEMANVLNKDCINVGLRAFVVTGVVPGNNKMNNSVQIPSHFWTAFCCLDNNNKTIRSSAYYGKKDDSVKEKDESEKEKDESEKEKDESVKEKDESEKEKDESEKEKDDSEKEKDESEKEKDESEKEKDESVNEKDESEKEKDESEKEKDDSEKEKDESEKEKDDSEKEKDDSEKEKDESEKEKDESEKEKDESVNEKDESEKEKDDSEKDKDESEKEKDDSEKEKDDSEKEKDEFVVYQWNVKNMETELTQLYKIHVNNIPDFRFTLFAGECYTETEPMEKQIVEKPAKDKKGTKACKPKKRQKL